MDIHQKRRRIGEAVLELCRDVRDAFVKRPIDFTITSSILAWTIHAPSGFTALAAYKAATIIPTNLMKREFKLAGQASLVFGVMAYFGVMLSGGSASRDKETATGKADQAAIGNLLNGKTGQGESTYAQGNPWNWHQDIHNIKSYAWIADRNGEYFTIRTNNHLTAKYHRPAYTPPPRRPVGYESNVVELPVTGGPSHGPTS